MKKAAPPVPPFPGWRVFVFPAAYLCCSLLLIPSFNDPASAPRNILVSLACLFLLLLHLTGRKRAQPFQMMLPRFALIAAGGILLSQVISFLAAYSLLEAIAGASRWMLFVTLIVVLTAEMTAGGTKSRNVWIISIWLASLIQAVIACADVLIPDAAGSSTASLFPSGTLTNSNLLGTFIAGGLPFAAWLSAYGAGKLRLAALISLLPMLAGLYFSGSRVALLTVFVFSAGALLLFILLTGTHEPLKKWKWPAILATPVLLAAVAIGLVPGLARKDTPWNTFHYLTDSSARIQPEMTSAEVRMVLWNKTLQMSSEHPLTGVGAGNWKLQIPRYGIKGYDAQGRYGMVFWVRPHNDFLWILSETGITGLLALILLFLGLLWYAFRIFRDAADHPHKWMAYAIGFAVIAWILDALFSFPSERAENLFFLSACAALLYSTGIRHGKKAIHLSSLIGWILAAGCVLHLWIHTSRASAEKDIADMRKAKQSKNWNKVLDHSRKAQGIWTQYEPQSATPFAWYEAMALVETARPMSASQPQQYSSLLQEALSASDRALDLAPYNFPSLSEKASTLALLGRHGDAALAFRKLLDVFPDNDEGWVNLAVCEYNSQNIPAAREAISHVQPGFSSPVLNQMKQILSAP